MAFPFVSQTSALRQRILLAIGSGGLAGLGCTSTTVQQPDGTSQNSTVQPGETAPAQEQGPSTGGMMGMGAAAGTVGSPA